MKMRDLRSVGRGAGLMLAMLGATVPALAAERTESRRIETAVEADRSVDRAASAGAVAKVGFEEARATVDAAADEVARLEAAKRAADIKANQAIAEATAGLQTATDDEAARLRADVADAIGASDEAGRALTAAKAALETARQTAARETRRLVEEMTAARKAAGNEVARLGAEAERSAEDVAAAVAEVDRAEAVRRTAEAEVERLNRIALEAVRRAAAAQQALAGAQASEAAVTEELTRLRGEAVRLGGTAAGM